MKAWVLAASGGTIDSRLAAAGWEVTSVTTGTMPTPTEAAAAGYDLVAVDRGYASIGTTEQAALRALHDAGISVYSSGNDTTRMPGMFDSVGSRETAFKTADITPVGAHPAAGSGWVHKDTDLNLHLTQIDADAVVWAEAQVNAAGEIGAIALAKAGPLHNARWIHVQCYNSPQAVVASAIEWIGARTVRATDRTTLTVLPAPSYVRTFYLLQSSTLTPPAVPTTNPPAAPWTTTEPNYTAGSTDTLYTVMLTAYGSVAFEFGEVQKSSSYEAAKQAYNLAQQANLAAATADGRLTVSTSAPTTANGAGKPAGAVWFRRDGSNRFNGAWEWSGTAWTARTIENAMIATLDAAKVNTGTLSADRIGARSVDVTKLRVADFTDYVPDPYFEGMPTSMRSLTGTTVPATDPSVPTADRPDVVRTVYQVPKTYDLFAQPDGGGFPVAPGDQFYVDAWVSHTGTETSGLSLRVWLSSTANRTNGTDEGGWSYPGLTVSAASAQDKWVRVTGVITVPAVNGAGAGIKKAPRFGWAALGPGNGSGWMLGAWSMRRRAAGELIVDGAVKARHVDTLDLWADQAFIDEATVRILRAGVIEVDMLAPGVGDSIDLTANGSINILVTQQADQAGQIANVNSAVESAQAAAETAANNAGDAQAKANSATDAAAEALAAAEAAQAQVDEVTTHYRFGPDGLEIGKSGSPVQFGLNNERAEFRENGVATTYWESGRMVVASMVTEEIVLANHKVEKYGTRTVVRSLG